MLLHHSSENDAHAPTNEARHNIINLIKNDREAMRNKNVAKKKATTKFKSDGTHHSGKMVGVAGAPMGLKGLRKAKQSKNKAKQKSLNEQGVEGEENAKIEALNMVSEVRVRMDLSPCTQSRRIPFLAAALCSP